ncbi:MAG: NAD(P)-dependent alcohol dehydrogenase [Pseudomonadota bacterium]
MKAMYATKYGGPEVIEPREMPTPVPGPGEVLIKVGAAGVTAGDWRMRAAAFPGGFAILGRAMFGLRGPRNPVLGGDVAGTIAAVGAGVSEFAQGDRVYGFSLAGAHAEYVKMKADGALVPLPSNLTFTDGAALPYGMLAAYSFLTRFAKLKRGEHVLVLGGSGGVGVYAIQIARMAGAKVTAVASAGNLELMRRLGADEVLDYRVDDPLAGRRYDVILDTFGAVTWRQARRSLKRKGRFVPLNFAIWHVVPALMTRLGGRRWVLGISGDEKSDLLALEPALTSGDIVPVIDRVYPFDEIRPAYRHVETRRRKGAVVLDMARAIAQAA